MCKCSWFFFCVVNTFSSAEVKSESESDQIAKKKIIIFFIRSEYAFTKKKKERKRNLRKKSFVVQVNLEKNQKKRRNESYKIAKIRKESSDRKTLWIINNYRCRRICQ